MATGYNSNWSTDRVFHLHRPTAAAIEQTMAAAVHFPASTPHVLSLSDGLITRRLPFGFVHDSTSSTIGCGEAAFAKARGAFRQWTELDLGWVNVADPAAPIATQQIVGVLAFTLGLWSLNLSRIVETVDTPTHFGFLYATTVWHVEEGEERFLIEFDPRDGIVTYRLEAVSRPRNWLARAGFPITRSMQRRFARDSHNRMRNCLPSAAE